MKVKQITESTGYNGKQYTLVVTECGKLLELTQTPEGKEEWRLISIPNLKSINNHENPTHNQTTHLNKHYD